MVRSTLLPTIPLVAAAATLFAATAAAQNVRFFPIATDATSSSLFAIGAAIAAGISNPPGSRACDAGGSCGVPGVIAAAQSTHGGMENLELLEQGRVESAFVQADLLYWAYHGTGPYAGRERMSNLRVIASLLPLALHVVVRDDAKFSDIRDLAGHRVSLGPEGSGSRINARTVLTAYGLSEDQIEPAFLNPGSAMDALAAGEIDAAFIVGAYPVPAIESLSRQAAIRLLPISGVAGEELASFYPFFSAGEIPSGTYQGVEAAPTVSVEVQWVIRAKVDTDFVENLTGALWHENTLGLLREGHPFGNRVKLENALSKVAIPLHPGAERWYRSAGIK